MTNSERSCHRALDESGTRADTKRRKERGQSSRDIYIYINRKGEKERRRQSASARDPLDTRATHRSTVPQPLPSTHHPPRSCCHYILFPLPSPPLPPLPPDRSPHPLLMLLLREPLMLCPSIRRRLHPLTPYIYLSLLSLIKPRSLPPPLPPPPPPSRCYS